MPITITTNQFKFKDPNTGQYRAISAVADESLEDRLAEISAAGAEAVADVTSTKNAALQAVEAKEAAADISAGAAASSAIDAGESADAASAAQTGAETAQVAAELAQTAAEAAATAADGSKTAAAGSATAAAASAAEVANRGIAIEGSKTLTNTQDFPFNNSVVSVALGRTLDNTDYVVEIKAAASDDGSNFGAIVVTDRLANGFKLSFTGGAKSVTVQYVVIGGFKVV